MLVEVFKFGLVYVQLYLAQGICNICNKLFSFGYAVMV